MITKDNIAAVLKHNGVEPLNENASNNGYIISAERLHLRCVDINLDHPNLIAIIEAHLGRKLDPLPEPSPWDRVEINGVRYKLIKE